MDITYWWSVINKAKLTQISSQKTKNCITNEFRPDYVFALQCSAIQWQAMHCAVMHCTAIWRQLYSHTIACLVHGTAHFGRSPVRSSLSRWITRCTPKVTAVSCRLKWPCSEASYSQGHRCLGSIIDSVSGQPWLAIPFQIKVYLYSYQTGWLIR